MKIVEVRGYWLEVHLAEPLRNSVGTIGSRSALFVEVIGEDGTVGWGETQRFPEQAWQVIESAFATRLLGRTTSEHDTIWRELADTAGPVANRLALSAIDIALWDLRGHIEGRPVAELLGDRQRERVTAYASGPFMKVGDEPYRDAVREAAGYVADHFTGIKVRCGVSPTADARILTTLRRELGDDLALMIDINKGYDRDTARELVHQCEAVGLGWVEEPLEPFDLEGYRTLTGLAIPIAGGESFSEIDDFENFLAAGALDLVQPDIYLCGGLTGAMQVVEIASRYAIPYLPHVFGAVINFHASLQLAAVLPARPAPDGREYPWFEFDRSDNPLRKIAQELSLDADGSLLIPTAPGIGVELTRDMLEPFVRRAWCVEMDRVV